MTQSPTQGPSGPAVVTRSEERALVTTGSAVTGGVRVRKRVVTEERTVTVTVRREELVVEELLADELVGEGLVGEGRGDVRQPGRDRAASGPPVLDLVLSEEQVEVVTRVVPVERVRVFVDRVADVVEVDQALRREVVDVEAP